MMETTQTYKIGVITREAVTPTVVNWAVHIDGARRNFGTLRAAKAHINRVVRGEVSHGLHVSHGKEG